MTKGKNVKRIVIKIFILNNNVKVKIVYYVTRTTNKIKYDIRT